MDLDEEEYFVIILINAENKEILHTFTLFSNTLDKTF